MAVRRGDLSQTRGRRSPIDPAREPLRLSVIMPVFNEGGTVRLALNRLLHTDLPCSVEVIVVDDGSTDNTWDVLKAFDDDRVIIRQHKVNRGKGAAVLTGIDSASGTHALVFDADLEYDPNDIPRLLRPVIDGKASTAYGTRLFGRSTVYQSFWFALGNRATTLAANVLYDAAISDLHTCLKLLPLPLLRSMDLTEQGFGLDTQITARMLLSGVRPYEVAISYNSRTHEEGKKIGWRHGVESLEILHRERAASWRQPGWLVASKQVARVHRAADIERLIATEEARIASHCAARLLAVRPIKPAAGTDLHRVALSPRQLVTLPSDPVPDLVSRTGESARRLSGARVGDARLSTGS